MSPLPSERTMGSLRARRSGGPSLKSGHIEAVKIEGPNPEQG
jgi:hypothetical protein